MRIKRPDNKNALSLIKEAENEMNFTLTLTISNESCSTIVRNIYECFRMLGEAALINKGLESKDHLDSIKELLTINVKTDRSLSVIDNLRRLRHNINYYGYRPSIEETNDALDIANKCFEPLLKEIKNQIK